MKYKIGFLIPILLLICLFFISGCEGDVSSLDEDAYGSLDTAAIAVSVEWPDEVNTAEDCDVAGIVGEEDAYGARMSAAPITLSDNCANRGVDKVRVEVQNSSGDTLKSATFECSDRQGTITGIEQQTGCSIIVSGLNSAGTARYRGSKTNVTLHAGMNNVGRIQVEPLYTTQYTVTASAGTGGSVSPLSRSVDSGSTASFTVSANSGYTRNTSVGETCAAGSWSGNTYTTGSITGNCSVSFGFSQITASQYTVTASTGTGGSVTPSNRTVNSGLTASFAVSTKTGYTHNTLVGGTCPTGSWIGNTYTTGSVTGNCSVSFDFVETVASGLSFTNSIGMTFVYIEPGSFMMGSPEDELGRCSSEPQHWVTLTQGYYMQTTAVTQRQWKVLMGDNPSEYFECGENCPVERISWYDAQDFIAALNQLEGSIDYRLPTEAQWEYAARAGSTTAFANGQISQVYGYDPVLDSMGWYYFNSYVDYLTLPDQKGTQPVAQKEPNLWGLYDMHGNVFEWASDWFDNYPSSAVVDPTGPSSGTHRVLRGGSFLSYSSECRSANRHNSPPHYRIDLNGFRLVLISRH